MDESSLSIGRVKGDSPECAHWAWGWGGTTLRAVVPFGADPENGAVIVGWRRGVGPRESPVASRSFSRDVDQTYEIKAKQFILTVTSDLDP